MRLVRSDDEGALEATRAATVRSSANVGLNQTARSGVGRSTSHGVQVKPKSRDSNSSVLDRAISRPSCRTSGDVKSDVRSRPSSSMTCQVSPSSMERRTRHSGASVVGSTVARRMRPRVCP